MVTDTITTRDNQQSTDISIPEAKVMFINWSVDDRDSDQCDLLTGINFSDCNILFFDPLEFAIAHGLRKNTTDLSNTEYYPFDERKFGRYLIGIKHGSTALIDVLNKGGILVLKSQIPNSHIKVSKRSTAGGSNYTQSLLSAFFWLEEILGKYSFKSCHLRAVKYLVPNDPVSKIFGHVAVDCIQTQNIISKGHQEIIAAGGTYFKDAIISRLTSDEWPGLIYIVPKFSVKNETALLIEAFKKVYERHQLNPYRPAWVSDYEFQLNDLSPYSNEIGLLEAQMEGLKKKMASLQHQNEDLMQLTSMLYRERDEMASAIETALIKIGFTTQILSCEHDSTVWLAVGTEKNSERIVFTSASTDEGPIKASALESFNQVLKQQNFKTSTKGILIGNAERWHLPTKRNVWFDDECLCKARQSNICLMPSIELFTIVSYLIKKSESKNFDDLKASICREIIACDSQFELNRKKYRL